MFTFGLIIFVAFSLQTSTPENQISEQTFTHENCIYVLTYHICGFSLQTSTPENQTCVADESLVAFDFLQFLCQDRVGSMRPCQESRSWENMLGMTKSLLKVKVIARFCEHLDMTYLKFVTTSPCPGTTLLGATIAGVHIDRKGRSLDC